MVKRIVIVAIILVLAAFFAFVGWNKAFTPLADLVKYGAWTVYLPETLGRLVGWSEMVCAAALLIRRFRIWSAIALIANQLVAATVHFAHRETPALPQNAILVGLLCAVVYYTLTNTHKSGEIT